MAPRARGMAMVKPSWPINASDPQTEGGGFLFIRYFSSVFSRYYTMRIIAHWNIYLQQLIHAVPRVFPFSYQSVPPRRTSTSAASRLSLLAALVLVLRGAAAGCRSFLC